MARQRIVDDIPAQICWQYLHGEFEEETNAKIHDIVCEIFPEKRIAITMILEIAYRCGYAKSNLMGDMSETTYKIKKKRIRDKLLSTIAP